jgi:hypothetical protein
VTKLPRGDLKLAVDVAAKDSGKDLRKVDPWLMAMAAEMEALGGQRKIEDISVMLHGANNPAHIEALRRRVSYLALNAGWSAHLGVPGGSVNLAADWSELFRPEPFEKIHTSWNPRSDSADKDGAKEKMLQTWLAGVGRKDGHRLAVLGEDFMYKSNSAVKVLREMSTGSFRGSISEKNRILPTNWIDLVTRNTRREIALIELKVSDAKLDVIAQVLDYALFFRRHHSELIPALQEKLETKFSDRADINCYIVNNRFHAHFDAIGKYYQPRSANSDCRLQFNKVTLGATISLGN